LGADGLRLPNESYPSYWVYRTEEIGEIDMLALPRDVRDMMDEAPERVNGDMDMRYSASKVAHHAAIMAHLALQRLN